MTTPNCHVNRLTFISCCERDVGILFPVVTSSPTLKTTATLWSKLPYCNRFAEYSANSHFKAFQVQGRLRPTGPFLKSTAESSWSHLMLKPARAQLKRSTSVLITCTPEAVQNSPSRLQPPSFFGKPTSMEQPWNYGDIMTLVCPDPTPPSPQPTSRRSMRPSAASKYTQSHRFVARRNHRHMKCEQEEHNATSVGASFFFPNL